MHYAKNGWNSTNKHLLIRYLNRQLIFLTLLRITLKNKNLLLRLQYHKVFLYSRNFTDSNLNDRINNVQKGGTNVYDHPGKTPNTGNHSLYSNDSYKGLGKN